MGTGFFVLFFFFFQAEDGIRDRTVTGVQTCALPIFFPDQEIVVHSVVGKNAGALEGADQAEIGDLMRLQSVQRGALIGDAPGAGLQEKIGRASCRERVESSGGEGGSTGTKYRMDVAA